MLTSKAPSATLFVHVSDADRIYWRMNNGTIVPRPVITFGTVLDDATVSLFLDSPAVVERLHELTGEILAHAADPQPSV